MRILREAPWGGKVDCRIEGDRHVPEQLDISACSPAQLVLELTAQLHGIRLPHSPPFDF